MSEPSPIFWPVIGRYTRYVKFFAAATDRTIGEALASIRPVIFAESGSPICAMVEERLKAYPDFPDVGEEVRESWAFLRPKGRDAPKGGNTQ